MLKPEMDAQTGVVEAQAAVSLTSNDPTHLTADHLCWYIMSAVNDHIRR
jgi:hypothetical protein